MTAPDREVRPESHMGLGARELLALLLVMPVWLVVRSSGIDEFAGVLCSVSAACVLASVVAAFLDESKALNAARRAAEQQDLEALRASMLADELSLTCVARTADNEALLSMVVERTGSTPDSRVGHLRFARAGMLATFVSLAFGGPPGRLIGRLFAGLLLAGLIGYPMLLLALSPYRAVAARKRAVLVQADETLPAKVKAEVRLYREAVAFERAKAEQERANVEELERQRAAEQRLEWEQQGRCIECGSATDVRRRVPVSRRSGEWLAADVPLCDDCARKGSNSSVTWEG